MNAVAPSPWKLHLQRVSAATVRGYHAYGSWLVGITWLRFIVLAVLLVATAAVLKEIPPFSWKISETTSWQPAERSSRSKPPKAPKAPKPPKTGETPTAPEPPASPEPAIKIEAPGKDGHNEGVEISIDKNGVRISARKPVAVAASAPQGASAPHAAASAAGGVQASAPGVQIVLPPGATNETVREAVDEARRAIEEAVREARQDAEQARRDAEQALEDARQAAREAGIETEGRRVVTVTRLGDALPETALFWILASAILKITYKRQIQAEAQAAQAVETAEAESLKRQVVEARMAAMQAQIEPHFLFNTLASIDHLIQVDPQRASQMQKNLIALLRASMPTMRDAAGDGGMRELSREVAVIRPYLEILKVRMEERLATEVDVPDGLLSAEFPPMMLQTLVENAIKHGLEPKPEGGALKVRAEVVHGKLAVSVADTGLGFGRAATAGTGVGLANIRERLQMLYGAKASLTIAENPGGGTVATITVPYKPVDGAAA